MSELKNVLGSISSAVFGPIQTHATNSPSSHIIGKLLLVKNVIVAWQDQDYTWELGVVDQCKDDIISVSHMVSTNKNKTSWVFAKEAVGFPVDKDQILM